MKKLIILLMGVFLCISCNDYSNASVEIKTVDGKTIKCEDATIKINELGAKAGWEYDIIKIYCGVSQYRVLKKNIKVLHIELNDNGRK